MDVTLITQVIRVMVGNKSKIRDEGNKGNRDNRGNELTRLF